MKEYSTLDEQIAVALFKEEKLDINNYSDGSIKKIFSKLISKRAFGIWEDLIDPEFIINQPNTEINHLIIKYNRIYHSNFIRHLEAIILISNELNSAGIHFILLKGSALRIGSYKFGYMRFTRDIDILIKEKDLNRAYQIMKKLGFRYLDKNCNDSALGSLGYARHLPKLKNKNNIIIEIHHRITDPKTQLKCNLSQKMLSEYDEVKFGNKEFNIPKKEHFFAHLLNHELTQKKENNLILLMSDLKNLLDSDINKNSLAAAFEDLKIDINLLNKIDPKKIDIKLIKKYSVKKSLSIFKRLKFLKHQISYEYQIPLKNIKFSSYMHHFKIKIKEKIMAQV